MLKMTAFGAVLVAVLMLLTVIRHTRGDEEEGRTELLRAGVVGRRAPLVAALILTLGASLLLGLLTALALVAAGLDARGAWAFGLSWACAGAAFAAVGAVAAQLTASARAARGVAVGGAGRVVRAARDRRHLVAGGPLVAVLALTDRVEPADPPVRGNRWWVALVPRGVHRAGGGAGRGAAGPARPGAGLVQPRPGPSRAGRGLRTPLGLAWRLHRALVPRLAERLRRAGPGAGQHGLRPRRPPGQPRGPGPDHPDGRGAGPHRRVPQHRDRRGRGGRRGVRRAGRAAAARGGVVPARRAGAGDVRRPGRRGWPATWWWRWPRRRP